MIIVFIELKTARLTIQTKKNIQHLSDRVNTITGRTDRESERGGNRRSPLDHARDQTLTLSVISQTRHHWDARSAEINVTKKQTRTGSDVSSPKRWIKSPLKSFSTIFQQRLFFIGRNYCQHWGDKALIDSLLAHRLPLGPDEALKRK